jgi:hypothetical protein
MRQLRQTASLNSKNQVDMTEAMRLLDYVADLDGSKQQVARDSLLYAVFGFWREQSLPVEPLEQYLIERSDLHPTLGLILESNTSNEDSPFAGLKFSSRLYLVVVGRCLKHINNLYEKGSFICF